METITKKDKNKYFLLRLLSKMTIHQGFTILYKNNGEEVYDIIDPDVSKILEEYSNYLDSLNDSKQKNTNNIS